MPKKRKRTRPHLHRPVLQTMMTITAQGRSPQGDLEEVVAAVEGAAGMVEPQTPRPGSKRTMLITAHVRRPA